MTHGQEKAPTRCRLLNAMVDAVARDGYVATTVAEVIAYAGASRSTFYDLFEDKDECFLEAAREIGDRLTTVVERRVGAEQPQSAPPATAEALLSFALEEEAPARLLFTELLAAGPTALDLRDALVDRLAGLVEGAWQRGAGESPSIDMPAKALIGGIFRLLSFRLRRGASGLHELEPEVLAWIGSYATDEAPPCWQSTAALKEMQPYLSGPVDPRMPPLPLPKGRRGLSTSEIARNHRDRLLHGTAAIVYEKGYAAVTVADIVRAAQVSRGVFYSHFRDKQAAVLEAMELTFGMSMTECSRAFFAASGWPEQLWAGARALSDYYATAPAFVHLAFVESYAAGPTSIQIVQERMMAFTLLLEQGFHERSEAAALPRTISEIIAFSTFELAYREVRQRQPRDFSHLLPQLAYMNLAPFLGPREATRFVQDKMKRLGSRASG